MLIDCPRDAGGQSVETSNAPESFRGLLLRHRGRTGLIQRDLAVRAGVSRGAVQDWEAGLNHPTAERLQALIRVLFEAGGLTAGQEESEARQLWAAAEREAPRMHTPFDAQWFDSMVLAEDGSDTGYGQRSTRGRTHGKSLACWTRARARLGRGA